MNHIIIAVLVTFFAFQNSFAFEKHKSLIEGVLAKQQMSFANIEHRELGDSIQLQWSGLPHSNDVNILPLENGINLSYGEIVYLAGDFIGSQNCSISSSSSEQKAACFLKQFNALNRSNDPRICNSPITRVPAYRSYFQQLQEKLQQASRDGVSKKEYYRLHGFDISKDLNQLSCGGSVVSPLFPFGQYIKLAMKNFDHFIPGALVAYQTGHQVAIESALAAHASLMEGNIDNAKKLLQKAYAQNAYANHYLSDALSTGHMRTPRREMYDQSHLPAILKLLIANLMHDEDNRLGLNVHNHLGHSWKAYGDGMLDEDAAAEHRAVVIQIMQQSANAVYHAFISGDLPNNFDELLLLPIYDDITSINNHNPLFKLINGRVYKRKNNFDSSNDQYTKWWSGVLTLTQFIWHT
jgi:hypothetical protein